MSKTRLTDLGGWSRAGRGLTLAAALLAAAGTARGQNALGDGTALDANQRTGGGGKNTMVRDFRAEQQLRNAIVTGNAAGGKSFRGDPGYAAANDFRAALGSNDIYSFSRDSAYSGLATSNLRGLGGLRYQLDQSTGGQTMGIGGDLIVARSGTSSSSWEVEQGARAPSAIDPFGHLRGSLRSTTDYFLENVRQPRILSASQDNSQILTASSLQGVKALSPTNSVFARDELMNPQTDESMFSAPTFGEESAQTSLKKRRATGAEEGKPEEPKPGEAAPLSELVSPVSPLQSVVESLKANAGSSLSKTLIEQEAEAAKGAAEAAGKGGAPAPETEKPSDDPFRSMLEELRRDLTGKKKETPEDPNAWKKAPAKPGEGPEEPEAESKDGGRKTGGLSAPKDEKKGEDGKDGKDGQGKVGEEEKKEDIVARAQKLLGDSQPRLETLLQKEGAKDLYSLHMARGQEALNSDRWFDAEERFSAALRAQPGDPMAAAGRVSAQIGAGMYLSAATNLRNTLRAYPELIPAKFDVALFPQGERLQAIRDQLSQRAELNTPVARDAGLLLAFIGHQTGNIEDVRNGFAVIGRVDQATGNAPDDLERIIRAVWLK